MTKPVNRGKQVLHDLIAADEGFTVLLARPHPNGNVEWHFCASLGNSAPEDIALLSLIQLGMRQVSLEDGYDEFVERVPENLAEPFLAVIGTGEEEVEAVRELGPNVISLSAYTKTVGNA